MLGRPGTVTPEIFSAGPSPAGSIAAIVPCSTVTITSLRQPSGRSAVSRCNLLAMRWLVRYPAAPVEGSFGDEVLRFCRGGGLYGGDTHLGFDSCGGSDA